MDLGLRGGQRNSRKRSPFMHSSSSSSTSSSSSAPLTGHPHPQAEPGAACPCATSHPHQCGHAAQSLLPTHAPSKAARVNTHHSPRGPPALAPDGAAPSPLLDLNTSFRILGLLGSPEPPPSGPEGRVLGEDPSQLHQWGSSPTRVAPHPSNPEEGGDTVGIKSPVTEHKCDVKDSGVVTGNTAPATTYRGSPHKPGALGIAAELACMGSSHRTSDTALEEALPGWLGLSYRSNWDGASSGRADTANLWSLTGCQEAWEETEIGMAPPPVPHEGSASIPECCEGEVRPGEAQSVDFTSEFWSSQPTTAVEDGMRAPMQESMDLRAVAARILRSTWAMQPHELTVIELISRGSTGHVFRGLVKEQEVAIKIISLVPQHASDGHGDSPGVSGSMHTLHEGPLSASNCQSHRGQMLQCFEREVETMSRVQHPNVLSFLGACLSWPHLFIVTELLTRGSVRDTLDREARGMPLSRALKVLRDAARGLAFLHSQGVLHRDVKAANLLINNDQMVKVCDFGTSRILRSGEGRDGGGIGGQHHNATAQITGETGTYRWMAPEVLRNKPYGFKADVFSFGITMWEVLTGGIPYQGMTPLQAALGVIQRSLRPPVPAGATSALASLMQSCWDADPAHRPSFDQVVCALDELIAPLSSASSAPAQSKLKGWRARDLGKLLRKAFGQK